MADPRAYSPNFVSVQQVASHALDDPSGAAIFFTTAALGSLEAAKHAARSFQQSFTSLRARGRRRSETALGEVARNQASVPRFSDARGMYDALVCQRSPLPDGKGWKVELIPAAAVLATLDIRDRITGEPITLGKNEPQWAKTMALALNKQTRALVTAQMWDEAEREKPGMWIANDGSGLPWFYRPADATAPTPEPYPSHPAYDEPTSAFDDVEALGDDIFDEGG